MTDNPNVRASTCCPLCGSTKTRGLVACWPCYNAHGLRNGNPEADLVIAGRESRLQAYDVRQALREAANGSLGRVAPS